MAIKRMNHAVLYVRRRRAHRRLLPRRPRASAPSTPFPGGAFLQAPDSTNDHDIGLLLHRRRRRPVHRGPRLPSGLYHLAWEVGTLADLVELEGTLPRGRRPGRRHRPRHHQEPLRQGPRRPRVRGVLGGPGGPAPAEVTGMQLEPLDLARELERYGARTPGGR